MLRKLIKFHCLFLSIFIPGRGGVVVLIVDTGVVMSARVEVNGEALVEETT